MWGRWSRASATVRVRRWRGRSRWSNRRARITAPSTGRVGAIVVYPGSSVLANQTTLVTVTQLDPINVSFTLPQRHLGDVLGALKVGGAAVTASVTNEGVEALDLKVGGAATAVFKAYAVMVAAQA